MRSLRTVAPPLALSELGVITSSSVLLVAPCSRSDLSFLWASAPATIWPSPDAFLFGSEPVFPSEVYASLHPLGVPL